MLFKNVFESRVMEEADDLLTGGGGEPAPGEGDPPGNSNPPEADDPLHGIEFPEGLDNDLKADPILQPYITDDKKIDYANALKSLVHAKRMVGKDKVVIPGKDASEDEWTQFFHKMGVPESADKYEIEFDKEKLDEDFVNSFKEEALKMGIMPSQATKMMKFYESVIDKSMKSYQEDAQNALEEGKKELTQMWGEKFDYNLQVANNVLREFGGEELLNVLKEANLQNNPKVLNFLHKLGAATGEDKIVDGPEKNKSTIIELQDDLAEIRAHKDFYDFENPNQKVLAKRANDIVEKLAKFGVDPKF